VTVEAAAAKKALFHTPLHPVKKMKAGDPMPSILMRLASQQPFG